MRTLLAVLAIAIFPAAALADVGFKCESVKSSDQLSGWLRFGSDGRGNSIQLEFWNGYPPITLVEADLDNGKDSEGGVQYTSLADRQNGAVAVIETRKNAYEGDLFEAQLELRRPSVEAKHKQIRITTSTLKCVRH